MLDSNIIAILSALAGVIYLVSLCAIVSKAKRPWWAVFIPIYNIYTFIKVGQLPAWWLLMLLISLIFPVFTIVVIIYMHIAVAQSFAKSGWFGLGMATLPIIFFPWLAFGSAQYQPVHTRQEEMT